MKTSHPIKVVQFGLGPIGAAAAAGIIDLSHRTPVRLVGAIDIDPEKIGKDVGLFVGGRSTGIIISSEAEEVLRITQPDVVIHCTSSFLDRIPDQFKMCMEAGANVVSSTEELSYPYDRHPQIARELDETARANNVTLLGTGVNPGYAMDTLALMATGVCTRVSRIRVERVVDASARRLPLQQKVGAGLSVDAFEARKATGTFGHIGLRESLLCLADGLGWKLEEINETLGPVVSEKTVETPFMTVQRAEVAGIHHAINGRVDREMVLSLDLKMYVGAPNARDAVYVEGDPPIDLVVQNGIFGDTATVATLLNAIPLILDAPAGLKTVKDLPVPRAFGTYPGM